MKKYTSSDTRLKILRRTAKEIANYRVRKKIAMALLAVLLAITGVMYTVAALYEETGSFSVKIDKYEMTKYGLTLSESKKMTHKSSHLNAKISEHMTNISEEAIPENIDMIDGEHNGRDYIAYTFYVQNAGEIPVSYEYQVLISNVTNNLDEAIRLRLYVDGEPTLYAKTRSDGQGAEPGTVEFHSNNVMAMGRVDGFDPLETTKFTVVVWIEGKDPDCIDWLIGGTMRLEMNIGVTH